MQPAHQTGTLGCHSGQPNVRECANPPSPLGEPPHLALTGVSSKTASGDGGAAADPHNQGDPNENQAVEGSRRGRTVRCQRGSVGAVQEDDYGVIDTKAWTNEVRRFYTKVILPTLTADDVKVAVTIGGTYIATEWIEWPASLEAERLAKSIGSTKDVDTLGPLEYEKYCAALVEKAGWKCKITPATGDQGADVLATKGGKTLVLQCKKYSANVGNSAVQEAVSAKLHFRATHAAVVTNAGFTRSAKQLANTTKVLLLSHVQLLEIDNLTD